jgi:hypothetical protein
LTANGKSQKAVGWLQPEWEIDPAGGAQTGGRTDKEFLANKAPTVLVSELTSAVAVSTPVTLKATVKDDGFPKPRPPRKPAIGQETPPLLQGGADAPVNVPQLASASDGRSGGGGRGGIQGPSVTWYVWRGPAGAAFSPRVSAVKDDQAETTVTFTRPGEYLLRARATDRWLTTHTDVKIVVK